MSLGISLGDDTLSKTTDIIGGMNIFIGDPNDFKDSNSSSVAFDREE